MNDPVYVVVETLEILDAEGFKSYQLGARAQVLERGCAVIARGARHFEGSPEFGALMIQKWPSEAAFVDWQESAEYQPLKAQRLSSVRLRMAIVPAV